MSGGAAALGIPALGIPALGIPALGIYVHWPFCLSKCPYCDFNSHVRERFDEAGWRDALLSELDHYARIASGRSVASIFFGGGTPSLMAPATLGAVIERVATRWRLEPDCEITLEANPNSAEQARFADFRAAGVNRVSIGIQSLDDAALRLLGRAHDAREGRRAIAHAAAVFDRFSFDLIYARPGQSPSAWERELDEALALAGGHLSLYQLTFEPGTRFEQLRRRGDLTPLDDDSAHAMYEFTQSRLASHGLAAYEISNHARAGQESRHNLGYWRYEDYVGVGPGAHGRVTIDGTKHALRAARAPETWIERVREAGHGVEEDVVVSADEAAREALVMGLRLAEGIEPSRFRRNTGSSLDSALDAQGVARAASGGFVALAEDGRLVATGRGRQVLNAVLAEIAR